MQLGRFAMVSACMLAIAVPAIAAPRTHRGATKLVVKHAVKPKPQSQRGIEDGRASQIQAALIQSGYLAGSPTGHWDTQTEAAMQKLQADNGWQTKLVPDSRAIIKLGLGPHTDSAINGSGPLESVPSSSVPPGSVPPSPFVQE